nr:MAG TPA: hypothetical protein [Caudoviricetes sp.]
MRNDKPYFKKKSDLEAFLKNGMPQKGRPKGEKKNA